MNISQIPTDDDKMNSQYQKLISNSKQSAAAPNDPVKENPQHVNNAGHNPSCIMEPARGWTGLLESMCSILESIEDTSSDIMDADIQQDDSIQSSDESTGGQQELIDELNRIFTPVLIMQRFENDAADKTNAEMSEGGVLSEKSIIKFDDDTRMAQLIAVCAKLIAKQKNTKQYQMYAKAYQIKKAMEIEIQKMEYDAAKALANAYLINVSTTNNSPVARDAATALMPATQH